ncbi:hypothetical protein SAMN02910384_02076 [Pseudobutyrivibrio sp. ACV-2]|uniref:hypothetical protein n=1 Tax=Pseudobutyrivibrio sp. ACV-2 TaxID=1520801 RepID=UPI00089AC353|nr:hypothetical protein [Pseudobutyrivibrio sp. ACV-2]SEA69656.1 hypothetical protein SAMN02910384_02076 [Pseudobutyrivibrio sp. ACV-2]
MGQKIYVVDGDLYNPDEKDDKLAEEYRDLFGMSQEKRKDFMGREMLKKIEHYGQYVIIRWQK